MKKIARKQKVKNDNILIVKVGSDERPASTQDLVNINEKLSEAANDPNSVFVTHHCIEFCVLPRSLLAGYLTVLPTRKL